MTVYINTAMVTGDFNLQALDNVNEITIRRDLEGTYNVFICTPERMYIFEYIRKGLTNEEKEKIFTEFLLHGGPYEFIDPNVWRYDSFVDTVEEPENSDVKKSLTVTKNTLFEIYKELQKLNTKYTQ